MTSRITLINSPVGPHWIKTPRVNPSTYQDGTKGELGTSMKAICALALSPPGQCRARFWHAMAPRTVTCLWTMQHTSFVGLRERESEGGCFLYQGTARAFSSVFRGNIHLAYRTDEPTTLTSIARWAFRWLQLVEAAPTMKDTALF